MMEADKRKLVGLAVKHEKYGTGTIQEIEEPHIKITFERVGEKQFRYPDAFETFLSVDEEPANMLILQDLEKRRLEEDYIGNKKSQELFEKVKLFDQKKAAEHERKLQLKIEKERQIQKMREQRIVRKG